MSRKYAEQLRVGAMIATLTAPKDRLVVFFFEKYTYKYEYVRHDLKGH